MQPSGSNVELRKAMAEDLRAASALCLRSKAHWGYDDAFMDACRPELTLTQRDLDDDHVVVSFDVARLTGVAQVSFGEDGCFLEKLFVNPDDMGKGIGQTLFAWCISVARDLGTNELIVEADPQAESFYVRMGCRSAGTAMSGSIPGRTLPRLTIDPTEFPP